MTTDQINVSLFDEVKKLQDENALLEKRIELLRKALVGLIGAETKEELENMEQVMRLVPGIEADKIAAINAIHALLSEPDTQAMPSASSPSSLALMFDGRMRCDLTSIEDRIFENLLDGGNLRIRDGKIFIP